MSDTPLPLTGQIALRIQNTFASLYPGIIVKPPRVKQCDNPAFGDYQSEFALSVSKLVKRNPMEVAQALIDAFPDKTLFEKIEAIKPGFINITLKNAYLETQAASLSRANSLLAGGSLSGKTCVIDYSSPNVAKTMHIGHFRATIVGDALCRLLKAAGARVISDNHIGDWGTQFGKLISAYGRWKDDAAYAADPIQELERLYQKFEKEKTEALEEEARAELVKLQRGDPENRKLWEEFLALSLREFNSIYARLGVTFDRTLGESFYNGMLSDVVKALLEKGIAVRDQGAVIVDTDARYKIHGPIIVEKKDGGHGYAATDLATIKYRTGEWNPDLIVYVTDARQQDHFRSVFAVADEWLGKAPQKIHVYFGSIKASDGRNFSSREGNVVKLLGLINEAVDRARKVVDEKNPQLPEAEKAGIADAVGLGALKYTELNHDLRTDTIFDWNRMLAIEGNTAPYHLYTHARIKSVLRKYEAEVGALPVDSRMIIRDSNERSLVMLIDGLSQQVESAAADLKPNYIAEYLFKLSGEFNSYYNRKDAPVLKEPDKAIRESRVTLYALTGRTIKTCLEILGIRALERM